VQTVPADGVADVVIRDATAADLQAISDLSNAMVTTSTIAWTETPETLAQREAWFDHQQVDGNPVLVADVDGTVVGYATYGDFRDSHKWPGYRFTIEHTIHVREDHWGRDIGRALLDALIDRGRLAGKHVIVAAIDSANVGSIRFHERLGFAEVARMPETGHKFGAWLELVLLQRIIDPGGRR
jgi:phosphinothricin acetyltransferase